MNRIYLFVAVLSITFSSCEKPDPDNLGTDWLEGVVHYTGAPELDGCDWLLLTEGVEYSVYNMPEEFLVDGLDIWFKGKELREYFGCGLQGSSFKIFEIKEVVEKPWQVRFLSDYPNRETSMDLFSLDSIYVEGDSIHILTGYSGGCAIHQHNLWALENGIDGDEIHLMLEHIGNGDMCEAWFQKWLTFSLKPLQQPGKSEVIFWMRPNPMMSMLYGPFTYKY